MTLKAGRSAQHALEQPQDEIDVQAALVGLVDHDHAVAREGGVAP